MGNDTLFLILGMATATMLVRIVPVLIVSRLRIPPFWRRFLDATPYAALGALIFPGIIGNSPQEAMIGLMAGGGAVLVSLARGPAFLAAFAAALMAAAGMAFFPI